MKQIDLFNEENEPCIFLCKPNRTTIYPILGSIGLNRIVNIGKLNELSFSLTYESEKDMQVVRNPVVDLIRERYFIRFEQGNEKEWFVINEIAEGMDEDKDRMSVHAFSLGYELNDRELRFYEAASKNVTEIMNEVLQETIWTLGYVDADFDILYRSFEISDRSILDFTYEVADKFGANVVFNTNNRTVNFYNFENIGSFYGLTVSLGKLLKTLNKSSYPDEMITVLKAFGKDGLTFNDVNPSGTNFIENYDYFMYPFELAEDGVTVLKHSNYMSDELCIALIKYQKLIEDNNSVYQSLLKQKAEKQSILSTKENELSALNAELEMIEDRLAVANATDKNTSQIIAEKEQMESRINTKNIEINEVKDEIQLVDNQITELKNLFSINNNFTQEELDEKTRFEFVRNWSNENIIYSKDLYSEAQKHLEKVKVPRVNFEIDIVNFLDVVEEKHNWDKLHIGDTILIDYEKFNVKVKVKIIKIDYDYDNHSIKLEIANFDNLGDDWKRMIRQSYTVSSGLNSQKDKWNETAGKMGAINDLVDGEFDANKRRIIAGVNESVMISRKGLTITSIDNPNDLLVAQAGILAISNDGGNTYKNAITTRGVIGERIIGKILVGVNLVVENDSGKFTFDSNGATIKNASFKLISETGGNGITISPSDGLVSTKSDNTIKTTLNATEGIKIEKNEFGVWRKKFYVDTNGTLTAEDLIANRLIFRSGNDILIDGTTRTIDFSKFTTKLGSVLINNIPIMDLIWDFNNNRQNQFNGGIIQTGTLIADKITTGTLNAALVNVTNLNASNITTGTITARVSNAYDAEVGGTLTIGNNGNPRMTLYTQSGSHRIVSNDSAGLRIQANSIGLVASGSNGVYVDYTPLVAKSGFRVDGGISQFNNNVTVNATLNASYIQQQGIPVATINYVDSVLNGLVTTSQLNAALRQKESEIVSWANNKFVWK
ncbi:phage tail protein [Bacillus sp. Bva_UNVM-123]|uniref:phage tail spike protein n=1 Tax=Bacillus sp. Bva_UNVM-123 TaxID=2829798 RepID=UPI00391F51D0